MKSYWDLRQPILWTDWYFCEPDYEATGIFVVRLWSDGYICDPDYEARDICVSPILKWAGICVSPITKIVSGYQCEPDFEVK